jgi:uncharacterized membrane protein YeaQ/YmgE (transglycosylase-associated protein family)
MVGLFSLLAYFVIGTAVAALERRGQESWEVTAIATAGAVSGAYVGARLGLYVAFGELLGLICSVAGAFVFVRVYRSQIVGMTMRDVAPASASEQLPTLPSKYGPAVSLEATESMGQSQTLFSLIAEAFGWGALCAFPTAAAGFVGHLIGSHLYPQPYEQIPSDFLFVPLGMVVGFVAAGVARLARRDWKPSAMVFVVGLVTIVYGGALFQYSRIHALPAHVAASLEPTMVGAIPCSPDTCTATDPPSQWYVTGRLRMKTSRLGATIDRIEITSNTDRQDPPPYRYTKESAAEAVKWRGPLVMLTGRHIPGSPRLVPDTESTYTITYPYHTKDGASRRTISISVYLTDAAGNGAYAGATWKVR